jgi:heme exporter protein A
LFEDLTFNVNSGSALHVVGANGSGKTSLLRILCGLSLAESGHIQFNGSDIKDIASEYRGQLCYLGHKTALKPDLTPRENLISLAAIRNEGAADPISTTDEILARLEVDHTANRPCRQLSAGQKQRIAIARVVMNRAPIWFLDEPGTSLDSSGIKLLAEIMRLQLERNGLIIFTSHQGFDLPFERLKRISLDG